jgi:vitamin B12 transporter
LRLRASYGESFRAPSLGELVFPFYGNPDLRPERGRGTELGASWQQQQGHWSLDVAAFDDRQRDLIEPHPVTFLAANVGRARRRGVDGELRFRGRMLEVRAGGMRLHAENLDTGEELLRRPERTAHVVSTARFGGGAFTIAGSWVGERRDNDPVTFAHVTNPAFSTVDLAGEWQLRPGIVPYARALNALDREYQPVLGTPAAGRTLIAGVRLQW